MQCVKIDKLPCESDRAICLSGQTGQKCQENVHDSSCSPQCLAPESPSVNYSGSSLANGFCNGILTEMHMTGFVWSRELHPCLVFLFPSFELTDAARFWAAAAGTLLAGVLAEYLIAVRRDLSPPIAFKNYKTRFHAVCDRSWRLLLYTSSRALGYVVMLISMTYSAELFISVLVGLTIGHALFNLNSQVGEDMTACCQGGSRVPNMEKKSLNAASTSSSTSSGQVRFIVTGMSCGACINTVRQAVGVLSEVQSITDSCLESGLVDVEFRGSMALQACIQRVIQAVEDVGFDVSQVYTIRDGQAELLGKPLESVLQSS